MKNVNSLLTKEYLHIINTIFENKALFASEYKDLAIQYINAYFEGDISSKSFDEIVAFYRSNVWIYNANNPFFAKEKDKFESVVNDETSFFKYVCTTDLRLKVLPKDTYVQLTHQTIDNYRKVRKQLDAINNQIEELKNKGNKYDAQSKLGLLEYYLRINEEYKRGLEDYFANLLERDALYSSQKGFKGFNNSYLSYPQYLDVLYSPKEPNELDNKCLDLYLPDYHKLLKYQKEDQKKYRELIQDYIKTKHVVDAIKDATDTNLLFKERMVFVQEALDLYTSKHYVLFVNAIPSFIEGIFGDLCLLCGIDEEKLQGEGFQKKLDELSKIIIRGFDYKYYSFSFRLLRNAVSHGRTIQEDVEHQANLLLLDVYDLLIITKSEFIPLNQYLRRVSNYDTSANDFAKYGCMMEMLLYGPTSSDEHLAFYGVDDSKLESIFIQSQTNEFWDFIDGQIKAWDDDTISGVANALHEIKKRYPKDQRAKEHLASMHKSFDSAKIHTIAKEKKAALNYYRKLQKICVPSSKPELEADI